MYTPIHVFNCIYHSTGFGSAFMLLVSTSVSMGNYSPRRRGLIAGVTGAFFFVGPTLFGMVYSAGFSARPIGNFFLCLSVSMIVVNILAISLIRPVPLAPETLTEDAPVVDNAVSFVGSKGISENWRDGLGLSQFALPSFQLLTWAFVFGYSVQMLYFANVTIYIDGYTLPSLQSTMPILAPAFAAIFTFAGGIVSDKTIRYTSRLTYLVIGTIVETLFFLISIKWGNNYYIFIITTLVVYSNNGLMWAIVPALVSEYFGMHHFTRNWGLLLMVNALLALALGYVFAWFYEDAIVNDNATCIGIQCFVNPYLINDSATCIGLQCFVKSYLLSGCISLLSAILFAILYVLERRQRVINATVPNIIQEHNRYMNNAGYGTIQWHHYMTSYWHHIMNVYLTIYDS